MGGNKSKEEDKDIEERRKKYDEKMKKRREEIYHGFWYKEDHFCIGHVFELLKEKNYEKFEEIVAAKPDVINCLTVDEANHQPTMLIHAIRYWHEYPNYPDQVPYSEELEYSIAEYLIKHEKCDIKVTDSCGYDALYFATISGQIDIVKLLLEKDKTVVHNRNFYNTPLHIATRFYRKEIVELFLQNDVDVDETNYTGKTADREEDVDKDIAKLIKQHRKKKRHSKKQ